MADDEAAGRRGGPPRPRPGPAPVPPPGMAATMEHCCCWVSVPKQGGYQVCRVPVMWFTALSARPESVQLPAMPVLAARAGDLSAVSGSGHPGLQTNAGGRPARATALRVPDAAPGQKS